MEVKEQSHRNRVFSEVQKAILSGELKPGSPLSEREYGKWANVSRVPVREAFILLESKGLVTMVPDRGAFVRTFNVDEIRQLYEVREGLEGTATRLAAGKMSPIRLRRFSRLFQLFLDQGDACDRDVVHRVNSMFHEAVIASCDNALLQRLIADIRDQCRLARTWRFSRSTGNEIHELTRHHLSVVEALSAGNGILAEDRMRMHIASGRSWFSKPGQF